MVTAGFSLSDVKEMTLDQVQLFAKRVLSTHASETLNTANVMRAAFHADEKQYSSFAKALQQAIQ